MLDTTSPNLDSLTLQKTTNLWENTETSKFRTIASNGIKLKVAKPGDYVGISIPGWAVRDVRRGQVVFAPPLNFTGKPADYHIAVSIHCLFSSLFLFLSSLFSLLAPLPPPPPSS